MKSIKPGRGPSGMSFIGSIIAVVFGLFWTIMAASMTANSPFPMVGTFFPLFGVIFILFGIINAVYNYKNATGKDRFSMFDITDSPEEGDPADKWIKRPENEHKSDRDYNKYGNNNCKQDYGNPAYSNIDHDDSAGRSSGYKYCPYCGGQLEGSFKYCPHCGRKI